jgi:hypothetical protein
VADNKIHVTEAVGDDSVMSSATADLGNSIRFLEFVTKAFELLWSDILDSLGLVTAKYYGILRYLDVYGECFEPVSSGARVDKREKLTDVVSVSHNISPTNIE